MRIENYRPQENNANEVARFDVFLDKAGIVLHEFRVVKKKEGGWFVSPPNFSSEIEGVKKWLPYVSITEQRKKDFFDKIHELVKEQMGHP
jgi:hypothetical protein